jgi:sulfatase modifying factor 1
MPAEFAPVMISVTGGVWSVGSGLSGQSVPSFQVGKYEVTCEEWQDVQAWAVSNGYADLDGIGGGGGEQNPVVSVSWHDVVKWCNAKSEKEGLVPVYKVGGATYKIGESVPTVDGSANGYRLPTESEWEWAARGGMETKGFTYSGSNDANVVAWYYSNSLEGTKDVGMKVANELGIYDMSGNVYEWCWDLCDQEYPHRRFRGGSCINLADYCIVAFRDNLGYPSNRLDCIGFRLARISGN